MQIVFDDLNLTVHNFRIELRPPVHAQHEGSPEVKVNRLAGVVKACGTLCQTGACAGDGAGHWRGRGWAARRLVLRKTMAGG